MKIEVKLVKIKYESLKLTYKLLSSNSQSAEFEGVF
jgi:hypothetical protein